MTTNAVITIHQVHPGYGPALMSLALVSVVLVAAYIAKRIADHRDR